MRRRSSYELDKLGHSLIDKLETVQRMLEVDKTRHACDNLAAFRNQLEAQRDKGLTAD